MSNSHDFTAKTIQGEDTPLANYANKTLLIVNVASQCGLTPQYTGLEALHRQYTNQGLAILGFPCNQFGSQEPGSEEQILDFCQTRYEVSFPLFAKIDVNGANRHPLYAYLAGEDAAFPGDISWNFEKFLIGKDGEPLARFEPRTTPDDEALVAALEKALA
jgi:glutathione peroxidase